MLGVARLRGGAIHFNSTCQLITMLSPDTFKKRDRAVGAAGITESGEEKLPFSRQKPQAEPDPV